ncbi:hypothetical protein C1I94_05760 [Akkermansia muciniphila]|uniref:hypothetical protein n=1 Tax=Akkermansia muciniphila TaxID=239935 RepID=UPI000FE1737C|nr:hypothetical protein [Akkermansia muciniphila]QAA41163.1 hypothetical protein C1I94_05760 [Akkermansia muciniphila]
MEPDGQQPERAVHQVAGGNHVPAFVIVRPVLEKGIQRHQEQGGGNARRHQQGIKDRGSHGDCGQGRAASRHQHASRHGNIHPDVAAANHGGENAPSTVPPLIQAISTAPTELKSSPPPEISLAIWMVISMTVPPKNQK